MENFEKISFELVNGNVNVATKLMARSLVLIGDNGTMYNITAKVRNTDKFSVVRALAKAVLASVRETVKKNSTPDAQASKKNVTNNVTKALSCHTIMVTDKNGNIITNSALSVRDNEKDTGKLRGVINFTKRMPLYKLVVEQGLDWSDESVVAALISWTNAAIDQMNYEKELDKALADAANSTEKEEKAAEAAAKKAEAAKKAAEKKEEKAAA